MLDHQLSTDIILESAAQLLVLEQLYIDCGELLCFQFWIFSVSDSFLALPADLCTTQKSVFPLAMS